MTVMAAEAGTAAFEGEAAQASAAASDATTVGGRGPRGEVRHDATPAQKRAARAQGASVQPRPRPDRPQPSGKQGGSRRKGSSAGFSLSGGNPASNYHGAILAEFVLAVLLVAGTPFASKNKTGVSPYAGKDMVQLLSLTLLYFLLAIFAGTGRGQARFAAWFGGLVLLAVGLTEAANIAKVVSAFFGGSSTDSSSTDSADATASETGTSGTDTASTIVVESSTPSATGLTRTVGQAPGTGLS